MDNKKIGKRINAALAEKNMQQKELAELLHVPHNTISYFCGGKRVPNVAQVIQICQILDTTPDYLLGFTSALSGEAKARATQEYTGLSCAAAKNIHDTIAMRRLNTEQQTIGDWFLSSVWFHRLIMAMTAYKKACIEEQTKIQNDVSGLHIIVDDGIEKQETIQRKAAKLEMVDIVLKIAAMFDEYAKEEASKNGIR